MGGGGCERVGRRGWVRVGVRRLVWRGGGEGVGVKGWVGGGGCERVGVRRLV